MKYLVALIFGVLLLDMSFAGWCWQESANVSDQSGTDGDCNQTYTGSYSWDNTSCSVNDQENTYDGNWDYGSTGGVNGCHIYYFVNYSLPDIELQGARISFANDWLETHNLPEACYNGSNVQLRYYQLDDDSIQNVDCYNSTDWEEITNFDRGVPDWLLSEEAIEWGKYDGVIDTNAEIIFPVEGANYSNPYLSYNVTCYGNGTPYGLFIYEEDIATQDYYPLENGTYWVNDFNGSAGLVNGEHNLTLECHYSAVFPPATYSSGNVTVLFNVSEPIYTEAQTVTTTIPGQTYQPATATFYHKCVGDVSTYTQGDCGAYYYRFGHLYGGATRNYFNVVNDTWQEPFDASGYLDTHARDYLLFQRCAFLSPNNNLVNETYIPFYLNTVDSTYCWQTNAEEATTCGGLDNGSYACSGSWDASCTNAYDNNDSTYGSTLDIICTQNNADANDSEPGCGFDNGTYSKWNGVDFVDCNEWDICVDNYINYSKPDSVSGDSTYTGHAIPSSCWDYSPDHLEFLWNDTDMSPETTYLACNNGTDWVVMATMDMLDSEYMEWVSDVEYSPAVLDANWTVPANTISARYGWIETAEWNYEDNAEIPPECYVGGEINTRVIINGSAPTEYLYCYNSTDYIYVADMGYSGALYDEGMEWLIENQDPPAPGLDPFTLVVLFGAGALLAAFPLVLMAGMELDIKQIAALIIVIVIIVSLALPYLTGGA